MSKSNTSSKSKPTASATINNSGINPKTGYLLAVLAQILLAVIYYLPSLMGKSIGAHDYIQGITSSHDLIEYYNRTGTTANWSSSMFSGMPSYQIWKAYNNVAVWILDILYKVPSIYIYISLLTIFSASALFYVLRVHPVIMFLGGSGLLLSNFTVVSLLAGHDNKVMVMALVPGTIAGIWLLYEKKKYLAGLAVVALTIALQIRSNHFQITYLMMFLVGIWTISNIIFSVKAKDFKHIILSITCVVAGIAIGALTNTTQLLTTYEYSKETQRGGASPVDLARNNTTNPTSGVGYEYATAWSYGKMETLTLLIPNFAGGASQSKLDENSNVYKTLIQKGVPANQTAQFTSAMPTYWGPQPFTAGTTYIGAILIFLMVAGFFIIQSRVKWWLIASLIVTFFVAWGANFSVFYKLLFNYLPMFNKFRTPTMIFYLSTIITVISAALFLQYLVKNSEARETLWEMFKKVSIGAVSIMVVLSFAAPVLFSFESTTIDSGFLEQLKQATGNESFAREIYEALLKDRADMMRNDSIRSTVFIALSILTIGLYLKRKINPAILLTSITALTIIDLWGIDARYINHNTFKENTFNTEKYQPTLRPADQFILQDKSESYRILDLTVNSFSEASPSYYHKNIGGYHSAKLNRYQDLITYQINDNLKQFSQGQPQNAQVINMLNGKYLITSENAEGVYTNNFAYGNAWLVKEVKIKKDAVDVFDHLMKENLKETALLEGPTASIPSDKTYDSDEASYIKLDKFDNDLMTYSYQSSTPSYAVFSEIYYNQEKGWNAYVDGKLVPHDRVNYVLRGLELPSGKHEIIFKMEPKSVILGGKVDLAGSALIILIVISAIASSIINRRKTNTV